MLGLVLGRAGSGKSEYCLAEIERLARAGKRSILIVPEQSSYSFERALALRLEGRLADRCTIRSFKRLCGDIFAECGGGAKKRVNDAEKCAVLRRAMSAVDADIRFYRRHKRDAAFFRLAVSVIDELKNGGVSPDMLRDTATRARTPLSREKLTELACIYDAYNAMLGRQYIDDADELAAAARLCAGATRFDGVTVFLDGYTGFTQPEFALIGALTVQAENLICTLCCDGDIYADTGDAFTAVRETARDLHALAKRKNIGVVRSVVLDEALRFRAAGLRAAERFYADGSLPGTPAGGDLNADGVWQITGADLYAEAELCAREISMLTREQGYHFADIAVVARDADRYRFAVERTFARYGVPLFSDAARNMLHTGFSAFVLGVLGLAGGMDTDAVFRVLKTGLCGLDEQAVCELENYCFVWNVDGGGWFAPFEKRPDGFGEPDDTTAPITARVEAARQSAMQWFAPFAKKAPELGARELVNEIWTLMERCGAIKNFENADEDTQREAQLGIGLLDRLYDLVGEEQYAVSEIADLYTLLAGATAVGEIPQGLEQVAFGAADRMRTQNPRAVFVIGLNDGIFPRSNFDAPLLTFEERDLLLESGAALSRDFAHSAAMERLYLYRAATAARERLYLCHARADQRGVGLQPDPETVRLCVQLDVPPPESANDPLPGAQNSRTAAFAYARALERGEAAACAAIRSSGFADICAQVDAVSAAPAYAVRDKSLPRALLGEKSALSASKIESFENCRFSYFLRYMLRVRPLEKAEINPVEAGSFVHAVMEDTLRAFDGDLTTPTEPELRAAADLAAENYVAAHLGDSAQRPRMRYLIERLKAQAARLVLQLRREQAQSEFRPADYELAIGYGAQVEPIELRTPNGETVYVEGKIDRVDLFQKDGKSYIRVVDYKTGNKSFSLNDVFYGLNIQMLLYLFTVCKNGGNRYENPVPAAVMYMPADPNAPTTGPDPEADARRAYRMDGLVLDEPEVAAAMERELSGVFVPVRANKDGSLRKDEKLASLEKLGRIESHIEKTVAEMAAALYDGQWDVSPVRSSSNFSACDWCDYASVCRRDRNEKDRVLEKIDAKLLFAAEEGADA